MAEEAARGVCAKVGSTRSAQASHGHCAAMPLVVCVNKAHNSVGVVVVVGGVCLPTHSI